MKNCYLMLNQVILDLSKRKCDGIAFYSIEQFPKDLKSRNKIYQVVNKYKKKILISLEDILLEHNKDIKSFENLIKIKFLLNFCPKNFEIK